MTMINHFQCQVAEWSGVLGKKKSEFSQQESNLGRYSPDALQLSSWRLVGASL